jgi:hypothetical protein
MIKNKKKRIKTDKLELAMPKPEEDDEFIEKIFKKLLKDKKNKEYKNFMNHIDMLNPNDFDLNRDLVKSIKGLLLRIAIVICVLEREHDEAQAKLREYQES